MMREVIYVFWTGSNEIPEVRKKGIEAIKKKSGVDVVLVDQYNLYEYVPVEKIHPAYQFLNFAHRADYLRCYFMHHFGGGYCDIKRIHDPWIPYFKLLSNNNNNILGVGYKEVSRHGVANIYQSSLALGDSNVFNQILTPLRWRLMQLRYRSLIGNCAFIFKPQSEFTDLWWSELNSRLDFILPRLIKHPALHPKERPGHTYDGVVSKYPVPWSWILGDILHPLSYKFRHRLLRCLPPPDFINYQ